MMSKLREMYFIFRVQMQYSWIYYFLIKLRKKYKGHFVSGQTDIVVEAWPRSGNTFFVFCINFLNEIENKDLKIAHHIHVPYQISLGIKFGLKPIVLVRHPKDAISSLVVKRSRSDTKDFGYIGYLIISYIEFYSRVLKDSENVIIYMFDDVIAKIPQALENLKLFDSDIQNIDFFEEYKKVLSKRLQVDRTEAQIALPNYEKELFKEKVSVFVQRHEKFDVSMKVYFDLNEKRFKF